MLKTGKYSRVRTLPVPTDSEKKVFVSNGWQRNLGLLFRGLPGPGVGREHSGVVLLREGRQVAAQQQQTGQQQQHRLLKTIILFGDDDVLFFFHFHSFIRGTSKTWPQYKSRNWRREFARTNRQYQDEDAVMQNCPPQRGPAGAPSADR